MARTALTVTDVNRVGTDIASLSAANVDGHAVENNGNVFLIVKNGDVSGITVTVQTPKTVSGLAVAEYTISVGAGVHMLFGPFPRATFNQDDRTFYVDFSAVSNITVAAFRLNPS